MYYVPVNTSDGDIQWDLKGETRTIYLPAEINNPREYLHSLAYDKYADSIELDDFEYDGELT